MTLEKHLFPSRYLGRSIEYYYLASETLADEIYLLYVQDGKDYLQLGDLEHTYYRLIQQKPELADKLVLILLHPGDSMARWNAYHHEGKDFAAYIAFMTKEFMPFQEAHLNRKIVKRALLGDSLAANISLNIAVENPKNFTHLLLQSAAISPKDIEQVNKTEQLECNIYQIVGLFEDEYVSLITKEPLYILSRNRQLYQVFKKKKLNIHYVEKNAKHEWVFWKKELEEALHYFVSS